MKYHWYINEGHYVLLITMNNACIFVYVTNLSVFVPSARQILYLYHMTCSEFRCLSYNSKLHYRVHKIPLFMCLKPDESIITSCIFRYIWILTFRLCLCFLISLFSLYFVIKFVFLIYLLLILLTILFGEQNMLRTAVRLWF